MSTAILLQLALSACIQEGVPNVACQDQVSWCAMQDDVANCLLWVKE